MKHLFLSRRAGFVMALLAAAPWCVAQYEWNGAGSGPGWDDAGNWTNLVAPPMNFTGRVSFTAAALGATNRLEGDRRIAGTAGNLTQGLHYNLNASDSLSHTTDLNGFTLNLDGGSLQVGFNTSNSLAEIRNGTLVIGGANRTDVFVGYNTFSSNWPGPSSLTITADFVAANLGSLNVGRNMAGNANATRGGTLDLTGATLDGPMGLNTLKLNTGLFVGANSGGPTFPVVGTLLLPAALVSIDAAMIQLGHERKAEGVIDFGVGSALTNLTCRGGFYLSAGRAGYGRFLNMPTGVTFSVGQSTALSDLYVGWTDGFGAGTSTGTLELTDSVFVGHLKDVYIGHHLGGNAPLFMTGRVDISTCQVVAPVANVFKANTLAIGSRNLNTEGAAWAAGTLRLPPAVTNLDFGTFQFGAEYQGRADIDIGTNSQLKRLSVTNALYWGGGFGSRIGYETGSGFVEYLPAGMEILVGLSNKPAVMNVGVTTVWVGRGGNMWGKLILTNGLFRAYVSELRVGLNRQPTVCVTRGIVDVKEAVMDAFEVAGHAYIGAWTNRSSTNAYGIVALPAGEMGVASNLYLGSAFPASGGLLDLYGTTVRVDGAVHVDRTGVVTARVYAVSCGLDVTSTDPGDFVIETGGRVHVSFQQVAPKAWGLRMAGDQRTLFEGWRDDDQLTWDTPGGQTPEIALIGGYTMLRFPSMPGSLLIVR